MPGEQIEERGAHGVHVRARAQFIAAQLLRRTEGRCAQEHAGRGESGLGADRRGNREAEIADFDRAVGIHKAVGRFDIAVQDTDALGGFESGDDLEDGVHRLAHGHGAGVAHPVAQRAAGHSFHRDDRCAADLFGAENVNAIRMIDRGSQAPFPEEALTRLGRIERVTEDLQRDVASVVEVFRVEHRAHAAFAQPAHDLVMPELLPRLGQSPPPHLRPVNHHDVVPVGDPGAGTLRAGKLGLEAGLEEALWATAGGHVLREFGATLGAATRCWRLVRCGHSGSCSTACLSKSGKR